MTKDWKYFLYLASLLVFLAYLLLSKDKKYDWNVSLAHDDKNPYGTYVLNQLLQPTQKIKHNYKTFYELKDSISQQASILILAQHFLPDREDTRAMLKYVQAGGHIFIAANDLSGKLADTLGVQTKDIFFENPGHYESSDSMYIRLSNTQLDTARQYYFKKQNTFSYLAPADTSIKKSELAKTAIVAKNENQKAVALKVYFGKGFFILSSTPLVFTNLYILENNRTQLISFLLSYLPPNELYWTEYYQAGRLEARSPLRFILLTEPLRWAYYITITAILIFILFEAKRKQRIIPVIKPLANTSLEFVGTIAGLYFEKADHKSIALKKILFFNESVQSRYHFTTHAGSLHYVQSLSLKAGVDEPVVQRLTKSILLVLSKDKISAEELIQLTKHINDFWRK
ncbi:MAG: DUF4350 domain-containing protein [Bacteroidetes bacterium]|nr:DUF4350 domain-containing protein [Bacteroidota bacterium]